MGLALLNGEPKNGKMDGEFGENRDVEPLCLPRLSPWLVAGFCLRPALLPSFRCIT